MQHALDLARPYWPLILALVIWPLVSAALTYALWWDTPARWDAFVTRYPRAAFAVRILRAMSPHLRKLVVAWRDLAAARSALPLSGVALPAEKQGALDVSATRPVEPPLPTPPDGVEPFDPHARQTIIHDAARQPIGAVTVDPRKGEGGYATGGVMLAACAVMLVASLGVVLCGCPSVIRDPVVEPPAEGCDAGATLCHNGAPWRCNANRWSQADRQCNRLATDASAVVCCATPSALRPGVSLHACVPMALCSPEVSR